MTIHREGRHLIANGIRHHYVRFGKGKPPLLVLPGITSPAATWEFVGEALAGRHDVYIPDIRGRGLSQGGAELRYLLDDYAADAAALIEALQLERPAILGHSMGARIGLRLAAKWPERVGKLLLADPPVSGPGRRPYPIALEFYLESLDAVSRGQGLEAMQKAFDWTAEQFDKRMEWLPTCDRTAIKQTVWSFNNEDVHQDMPHVQADTLLLYAERGGTVLEADAAEIVRSMPRCHSLRVDNAGHMIPWDQLEHFVQVTQAFFGDDGP